MKKRLGLLLSSLAVLSLISCNQPEEQKQEDSGRSSYPILITSAPESNTSSVSSDGDSISSQYLPPSQIPVTYYHVTFVNYDESVLYEAEVEKGNEAIYRGETPTKEEDDEFTYEFDGWDKELTNIQSDTTFVATFKPVAKENWGSIHWF